MRIVQIVHGLPPAGTGGTELYVDALSRALASLGHEVVVIAREAVRRHREYAVREEARGAVQVRFVNNTFSGCTSFEDSYRNPRLGRTVRELATRFEPDVVHIHHLTCLSSEIPAELASSGIPSVMTLHDYWLACHRGQLLDRQYRVCAGPGNEGCGSCIGAAGATGSAVDRVARGVRAVGRYAPGVADAVARTGRSWLSRHSAADVGKDLSLARWVHMRAAASHIRLFLAPSEDVRQRFIAFGIAPDRIVRHEQGIDIARFEPRVAAAGPLRIGYFGSLVVSKGPEVLLEAFRQLPPGSAVLRVFGNIARYHDDPDAGRRLRFLLTTPGIDRPGPVRREDVPRALRDLDVVVLPSIWPENAPFVLREARAAGVAVVASRIGGIPEFVQDDQSGLLFQPGDAADCARALLRLVEDRALLEHLSRPGPVRTLADDARGTLALYDRASGGEVVPRVFQVGTSPASDRLAAVILNYHTPDQTVLAVRSLLASDRRPDHVIAVDNDSQDQGEELRSRLPSAFVLPLTGNQGFAAGVNAGIRHAIDQGATLVSIFNSDAVAAPDALGTLEEALRRSGAGIAGAALISRSDPGVLSSLGMSWSRTSGRMRHVAFGRPVGERLIATTRIVDGVSGCAMLVRGDVFRHCGYFDEEYFFGFEDLEFCLRASGSGFRTICCPEALVYHEGGRSIGRTAPSRVYFSTRNHLKLAAAEGGSLWARLLRETAVLAFNMAYVLRSPDVRLVPGLLAFARGAGHHFVRRYGPA